MKKIFIVITSCLIVLCGIFAAETVTVSMANDRNKRDLENVYKSEVLSLGDCLSNLEVNMSKITVGSGTKESRALLVDTYRQAETAAECVSVLPLSFENLTSTTKFFNQVGDWCLSYIRAIDDGADVEEYKNASDDIYAAARSLSLEFNKIEADIDKNGVYSSIGKDRVLPVDFENAFSTHISNSVDYPALIYDGPFSDGKTYNFKAIDNLPKIDREEAKKIAKEKFGITALDVFLTENKTSVYYIDGMTEDGNCSLMLTEKGGVPVMMSKSAQATARSQGGDRANEGEGREYYEQKAIEYMQKLGFFKLKAVWYNAVDGVAVVNLAPEADGVIYYTDLVKVKLLIPGGEIIGFESSGYCEKNTVRTLPENVLHESEAAMKVSPKIKVSNVRLCVIPLGEKEKFCYEFAGEYNGLDYFVYIDAVTGDEANILRVVDNDQGSMTM
ncbi:MAG: PepSY1/2 domain-containing protein [Candidatus Neoclostridium sp.]